jgi:hypothetical protein
MVSFLRLCELIDQEKQGQKDQALFDSGEDTKAMQVARQGLGLRKEGESGFWDDFISLCNNSEALAQLLNVSEREVRNWPQYIKEAIEKVDKRNQQGLGDKINKEIIPTEGPSINSMG